MKNKPALVIGIPFGGRYVPPEWAMSMATLLMPMNTNYSFLSVKGMKRDLAREYLAQKSVDVGAKYLLFVDDDTVLPHFAVNELMFALENADDDVMFCGGIYTTKTMPAAPTIAKEPGAGPFWKWKTGDIFECPYVATGAMMIKTEVFSKIPQPWFKDITSVEEAKHYGLEVDDASIKYDMTDDIFFCRKVQLAGYKGLAHGGVLPVHFDEFGNAYILDENSYPVRNGTVKTSDGFGFQLAKISIKPKDNVPLTEEINVPELQTSETTILT